MAVRNDGAEELAKQTSLQIFNA